MRVIRIAIVAYLLVLSASIEAQIITTTPAFPTQYDTITIVYDASEGNGELNNVIPIYAHTGVITSNSQNDSDWEHVVGDWGTVDPDVVMTPLGNNLHEIVIDVQNFYSINAGEEVFQLAFVFRNSTGTLVGREADGGDIYIPLYEEGNSIAIVSPTSGSLIANDAIFEILAQSADSADLTLFVDEVEISTIVNDVEITSEVDASSYTEGLHWISFKAEFDTEIVWDSVSFTILGTSSILPVPDGLQEGISISESNPGEVSFNLFAPGKGLIYLIGDFNDWQFSSEYILNQDPSGDFHWITIDGLDVNEEYAFQYFIADENLRIGDPYCEKILDPWNDDWIEEVTYPDLKPYPVGLTMGIVSVFQIEEEEYTWTDQDYIRPDQTNIIVYELLVRDFIDAHSYQVLKDTLNYLESLGVTAIELMPINEFEGNNSWGYNPAYYFAPDKYYGSKNAYKEFIDECHSRGIAVIMDIALNHSFGQNPQVKMYFDASAGQWGQPTADSPWFNEIAKHDYNVGYDYNHESEFTKKFVDSVLIHWVTEYHIDGYRLDLSKGFTQNNTLGDVGAWGQYDQSRVDILNDYGAQVWDYDAGCYMILEHFADNNEEEVLSDAGFMIWGNMNHEYLEASMGYSSNLNWGSYQARGWTSPHLVTYMESHDEERMIFKNMAYGASNGSYDITEFNTAMKRAELAAVFFIPIPGPKMIWQFGELGYDYSINYCEDGSINESCRTHPKPIEWGYTENDNRDQLYRIYKELIKLKKDYPVFSTTDYVLDVGTFQKSIRLNDDEMNVAVLGNFATSQSDMNFSFVHGGYWYEYFTGDSLLAGDFAPDVIPLEPGEYRLYTDVKISNGIPLAIEENEFSYSSLSVYPNPGRAVFNIVLPKMNNTRGDLFIYSSSGILIDLIEMPAGNELYKWRSPEGLPSGMYFIKLIDGDSTYSTRIIIE